MLNSEAEARVWLEEIEQGAGSASLDRLSRFVTMLLEENKQQNLIAASTVDCVWRRHIADSAQLLIGVPRGTATWLDIGSGAGLPGLVIAILRPSVQVTLVEARQKRAAWLNRSAHELGLRNVSVISSRVQRIDQAAFDVISARAVASLSSLLAMAARFSTADTLWRLPKGRSAQEELQNLTGWEHTFHVEQSITDPEAQIISGRLQAARGVKQ